MVQDLFISEVLGFSSPLNLIESLGSMVRPLARCLRNYGVDRSEVFLGGARGVGLQYRSIQFFDMGYIQILVAEVFQRVVSLVPSLFALRELLWRLACACVILLTFLKSIPFGSEEAFGIPGFVLAWICLEGHLLCPAFCVIHPTPSRRRFEEIVTKSRTFARPTDAERMRVRLAEFRPPWTDWALLHRLLNNHVVHLLCKSQKGPVTNLDVPGVSP